MTGVYYNSFTIYTDIFGKGCENMKIEKVMIIRSAVLLPERILRTDI